VGITIKPKIGALILQGLPISASEEETVRETIAPLRIMERFWVRRPSIHAREKNGQIS